MFSIADQKEEYLPIKRTGDNVYYNIIISNVDEATNPTKAPRPATFLQSNSTPIFVGNPQDWLLSVMSIDVPSQLIPVQIIPLQEGSNTDTTYKISLVWDGHEETSIVQWAPQDLLTPTPPPATPYLEKVSNYSPFLSLFSMQYMCKLINDAFQDVFTSMSAHVGFPATAAPFISYDADTLLFQINAPAAYLDGGGIDIYFNCDLMKNFLGTIAEVKEADGSPDGLDHRLLIMDLVLNRAVFPAPYGAGYILKQEVPALQLWYSFASLILSTGMPVAKEWTATNNDLQNSPFVVVLTDFQVPYKTGTELRNFIQYQPTAEFRRLTMPSADGLRIVDLKLYWRLKTAAAYIPVLIPFFNQVNVKLLFEKK